VTLLMSSFNNISVEKTLHSVLSSEEYVKLLMCDKYDSNILQEYKDEAQCKTHALFSNCNKISIMIQLFYDVL